ncbi:MAG: hypothetical protein RR501_10540 [Cloacibacillus sp.]
MGVSFTYNSEFGGKIIVGLPKRLDRRVGMALCDAVEGLVQRFFEDGGELCDAGSVAASAAAAAPDVPAAPVAVYAPWPREGSVTKKDIAAAWEIGASSWDRLVGALASPPARVASPVGKDGNPVPNAPARWWVADVEEIMRKRGIQRRRIVKG